MAFSVYAWRTLVQYLFWALAVTAHAHAIILVLSIDASIKDVVNIVNINSWERESC